LSRYAADRSPVRLRPLRTGWPSPALPKARCFGAWLRAQSVALIVKAYAARLGLDADAFSGHSLRSGFLTSAAARGASLFKMICDKVMPFAVARFNPARLASRVTAAFANGCRRLN
jgi:hypothetical protein